MTFILMPHTFNGQDQWKRPKRAPRLRKPVVLAAIPFEAKKPLKELVLASAGATTL